MVWDFLDIIEPVAEVIEIHSHTAFGGKMVPEVKEKDDRESAIIPANQPQTFSPETSAKSISSWEVVREPLCEEIADDWPEFPVENFTAEVYIQKTGYSTVLGSIEMKNSVTEGEYAVVCDFSENNAFVVQDEAPGFH
ncbi:hypothetical protein J437_LFUL019000 [Ladona fulva]|uniref:Uncharacterized protein n=1 Tax=Ladona fulva TaxID=123851 RepID=A0A8K0KN50_LADFU|nr:hypothetical protein J437_LFUL019000 [Ladona fulva]